MANTNDTMFRSVVEQAIAEHFPEELDLLPAAWVWWENLQSRAAGALTSGLPAVGGTDQFNSKFLILVVWAVFQELNEPESWPSDEVVHKVVRSAASALGLLGKRLDRVTTAATSTILSTFDAMRDQQTPWRPNEDPEPGLAWIETWHNGQRTEPTQVDLMDARDAVGQQGFDIVLDELAPAVYFGGKRASIGTLTLKHARGLWATLHFTGTESVTDKQIVVALGIEDMDPGLHRQVAFDANDLFKKRLDGRRAFGKSKGYRPVLSNQWTWCWLRSHRDQASSLLRDP